MKILIVSDEECPALWEYYVPGRLKEYDLILSCGDLNAQYLSFLVTMSRCPVLYVHGNHDTDYKHNPPWGCDCIDDAIVEYNGIRFMGLGGCKKYHEGPHQVTEGEMRRRIRRLRWQLLRHGGVDIVGDHDDADIVAEVYKLDKIVHLPGGDGVKPGDRLVQQKKLFGGAESTGKKHPLLLAAGQLPIAPLRQIGDAHAC